MEQIKKREQGIKNIIIRIDGMIFVFDAAVLSRFRYSAITDCNYDCCADVTIILNK